MAALERLGLVLVAGDGSVRARPPREALERLAQRRLAEAQLAREYALSVADLWQRHRASADVEVVDDPDLVQAVFRDIQDGARREVAALSIGSAPSRHPVTIAPGTLEALGRGVEYRVVYGAEVLKNPEVIAAVQTCVDAGEQARVFPGIAVNLVVVDQRIGFVMYPAPDEERRALVVHRSGLLDGLRATIASYWQMAVPISSPQEAAAEAAGPSPESRQLLTYLSAGLTDEAIGRELAVSERTVARRVARMQEMLGARGRFQLGVQAIRRGWL